MCGGKVLVRERERARFDPMNTFFKHSDAGILDPASVCRSRISGTVGSCLKSLYRENAQRRTTRNPRMACAPSDCAQLTGAVIWGNQSRSRRLFVPLGLFPSPLSWIQSCAEKGTVLLSTSLAWPAVAGCSRAETFSQLNAISFAQPCTYDFTYYKRNL